MLLHDPLGEEGTAGADVDCQNQVCHVSQDFAILRLEDEFQQYFAKLEQALRLMFVFHCALSSAMPQAAPNNDYVLKTQVRCGSQSAKPEACTTLFVV